MLSCFRCSRLLYNLHIGRSSGSKGILHGLSNVLHIARIASCHGEPAILGAIDVPLIGEDLNMLGLQGMPLLLARERDQIRKYSRTHPKRATYLEASVRKHANLGNNVVPVRVDGVGGWASDFHQSVTESGTHIDNSVGHQLQLADCTERF